MEGDKKNTVITTIRFTDVDIKVYEDLRIWALKHRVSMSEAIKQAILLLLAQEEAQQE